MPEFRMPDTPPPLPPPSPAPDILALDTSDVNATQSLYQAAIGPVHAARYLALFTRFEAADRAGLSWNWAASLCTLGWMVFRRMGVAALVYLGVASVVLMIAAVLAVLVFQGDPARQWGVGLVTGLLLLVVPGLLGDSWFYAHCRKRMARALADSSSWSEAASLLGQQAVAWPRAGWVALGQVGVLGAVAAMMMGLSGIRVPESAQRPDPGPVPVPSSTAAQTAASAASPVSVPASAPASGLAVTQAGSAPDAALARAASEPSAAASAAGTLPATATAPATAPAPAAAVAPPSASASAPTAPVAAATPSTAASRVPAAAAPGPAAVRPDSETAPTASRNASTAAGRHLVNVGLFAVASNARAAHARLRAAGIPATMDELQTRNGPRTRVRAGPFATRAAAEAAAQRIRALGLEAQPVKPDTTAGR